jgi:tetratricopeptide (TPR) repeat protein
VRTPASFRAALVHFREALARDPSYGPGWIGIARARNMQINYGLESPESVRAEMEDALGRAREFGADAAELLAEQAHMRGLSVFDFVGAVAEFRRALELAPNNARVWYWRGIALAGASSFAGALDCLDRAQSLDPLSYYILSARGLVLYFANRIPEALVCLRRAIDLSPELSATYWIIGMVQATQGDLDAAIANSELAAQRLGRIGRALAYLGFAYARAGRPDDARAILRELESGPGHYVPPYFGAVVLCGLGEREQALARLERAAAERDSMLRDVRVDRVWDGLRDDPRFAALSTRMRFTSSSGPTLVQ